MTPPSEPDYFLKREVQERAIAAAAIDTVARRIHFELADRYAERARTAAASSPWSCNEKNKGPALT